MKRLTIILLTLTLALPLYAFDWGENYKIDSYLPVTANTYEFSTGGSLDATSITYTIYRISDGAEIVGATTMTKSHGKDGGYLNNVQLTTAAGFAADTAYEVIIDATVGGTTVNLIHTFYVTSGVTVRLFNLASAEPIGNVFSGLVGVGTGVNQIALTGGAVTVGTNNDKTGYELSGTQSFDNTGTWTGSMSGSVGSVAGDVSGKVLGGGVSTVTGTGARVVDAAGNNVASAASLTTVEDKVDTLDTVADSILADTGTDGVVVASGSKTGYALSGTQTFNMTGNITGNVIGSLTGDVGGKVLGGGAGTITGTGARVVDASGSNVAPASTALSNATWTAEKAGYIDAAISSRLATSGYTAPDNASITAILADTGTDGVVVASGSKGGYSLAADQSTVTVGTVNAATLANGAHGGAAATLTLGGAGGLTGSITGNLSGSVGSVTGAVGSVTAGVTLADDAITAGKFDETTAFPLASADTGATAVARTGADSDTLETLSDQLDTVGTNVSSVLSDTGTDGVVVAAGSKTGYSVNELTAPALADLFNTDSGTTYAAAATGSVVKEMADNAGGSALTVPAIVAGVWDALLEDYTVVGSTGAGLAAAGSLGDPWSTVIPGSYDPGTAGYIIGGNLNAPTATIDTVVDAIKAKTDSLNFTGTDVKATLDGEAVTLADGAHGGAAATLTLGGAGGLTGAITGNLSGSVGSVTGSVDSVTDPVALTSAYDAAKTAAQAGNAMTLTSAYDAAKTAAQAGDAMTLTAAYDAAKIAAAPGSAMTLLGDQSVNVSKVGNVAVTGPDDLKADVSTIAANVASILGHTGTTGVIVAPASTVNANVLTIESVDATDQMDAHGGLGGDATAANQTAILNYLSNGTYGLSALQILLADVPALAEFFTVDSGQTYTTAVEGSVVAELANGAVSLGHGLNTWTYTVTSSGTPIASVTVWVTTDAAGKNIVARGTTDAFGVVTFHLDTGTWYVWRTKAGWTFTNPDTETVP